MIILDSRSGRTWGEHKAENSCIETGKSNFTLPGPAPPPSWYNSAPGENILANQFLLGRGDRRSMHLTLELFEKPLKGLVSVFPHSEHCWNQNNMDVWRLPRTRISKGRLLLLPRTHSTLVRDQYSSTVSPLGWREGKSGACRVH